MIPWLFKCLSVWGSCSHCSLLKVLSIIPWDFIFHFQPFLFTFQSPNVTFQVAKPRVQVRCLVLHQPTSSDFFLFFRYSQFLQEHWWYHKFAAFGYLISLKLRRFKFFDLLQIELILRRFGLAIQVYCFYYCFILILESCSLSGDLVFLLSQPAFVYDWLYGILDSNNFCIWGLEAIPSEILIQMSSFIWQGANYHFFYPKNFKNSVRTSVVSFLNWYTFPTSITGSGLISTTSFALWVSFVQSPVEREVPITKAKGYYFYLASPPYNYP